MRSGYVALQIQDQSPDPIRSYRRNRTLGAAKISLYALTYGAIFFCAGFITTAAVLKEAQISINPPWAIPLVVGSYTGIFASVVTGLLGCLRKGACNGNVSICEYMTLR